MRQHRDSVRVLIVVQIGDRTVQLSDRAPLVLSGDARRWRRQVTEHTNGIVETLLDALGARFKSSG